MSRIHEDVTAEDLARWRKQAEQEGDPHQGDEEIRKIFPQFKQLSDYRDRWCAAQWLARALDELGCDPELNERICFALGQINFHRADPWPAAREALDNFRIGKWETPGYELSMRLFQENLPQMLAQYGALDVSALRKARAAGEKITTVPPEPFPYDPV